MNEKETLAIQFLQWLKQDDSHTHHRVMTFLLSLTIPCKSSQQGRLDMEHVYGLCRTYTQLRRFAKLMGSITDLRAVSNDPESPLSVLFVPFHRTKQIIIQT